MPTKNMTLYAKRAKIDLISLINTLECIFETITNSEIDEEITPEITNSPEKPTDPSNELLDNYVFYDENNTIMIINTACMKENTDYDKNKLYQKTVDDSVEKIKIENELENVQLQINNRKDKELDVEVNTCHKVQIDSSNSNFPISLPAD